MHCSPPPLPLFVPSLCPLSTTKSAQAPPSRCGVSATQCPPLRGCGVSSRCASRGQAVTQHLWGGWGGLGWGDKEGNPWRWQAGEQRLRQKWLLGNLSL